MRRILLGIETSCDETAAAVVAEDRAILADVVLSQIAEHEAYGGVVPEIAARAHLAHLNGVVRRAMAEAGLGFGELAAVAAAGGPGLIGGVIVGVMTAKGIAAALGLPFLAVNHLEGHALTARLTHGVAFPYLLLLVSGGHCQLLIVEGVGRYARLGTTIDDAAGECFDKAAKAMGLEQPGGPAIERAAAGGDPERFALPRPMVGRPGCDFSFSGLKTAVKRLVDGLPEGPVAPEMLRDLAAALQTAVADSLVDRTRRAVALFRERHPSGGSLVVAGGVAANAHLRTRLADLGDDAGLPFVAPPLSLCTDNAAMIAWAGIERHRLGRSDDLAFAPRPRWPLDEAAPPARGAGVKA
jgi:N6-L-threonylcarbamoyladenine synthase